MPFRSEAQRRWMYKNKPALARKWQKEYFNSGGTVSAKTQKQIDAHYHNLGQQVVQNFGSELQSRLPSAISGTMSKALGAGVDPNDVGAVLRDNALKARNARQGSALAGAGLAGLDRASANQAGLTTQAGLNQGAFTPSGGALSEVGRGIQQVGAAEAQYQDDLSQITSDEAAKEEARAKELKATQEEDRKNAEAIRNLGEQAKKAYGLVDNAAQAIYAKEKIITSWNNWYRTQSSIPYVNQGAAALAQAMDEGIRIDFNAWQRANPEAAKAYGVLERVVTQLTTGALEALGPGPKTDFDFIVAGRTVADLEGSPVKIKATLADAVYVANEKLRKIMQEQIPFETTGDPVDETGEVETSVGSFLPGGGSETNEPVELDGLEGKWLKINDSEVPADVKELHSADNNGKEIKGDDGKFYVFTATIALGYITPGTTTWYRKETS